MKRHNYYGFISHRSVDKPFAEWLQKKVENYHIPRDIRKQKKLNTRQIRNLCLDVASFSGSELMEEVNRKLKASDKLILICSKASASPVSVDYDWSDHPEEVDWLANPSDNGWVGYEIVKYLEDHDCKDIIPVVIDGDPIARDCFHPYLREHFIETDILKWQDFRGDKQKDRKNLLRLIGAILSVDDLDDLIKRDTAKRKIKTAVLICAAALAIAAGIFSYDYFVPHTAHYADYTLVNGLPQGIGSLGNNAQNTEHYVITTCKADKTTLFRHVNAHQIPAEDLTEQHPDAPVIARYKCRSTGRPDTVEYLDRNNTVQMTYAYTTDLQFVSFQENEFTSDQVYPTASENEYGAPVRLKIDRYNQTYDENGYLIKRMYMSGVNYVVDDSGVAGEQYEYDSAGRLQKITYLNPAGAPTESLSGLAGMEFGYDEQGRQDRKSYLKLDGTLAYGPEDYAFCTHTYSEDGLLEETACFGTDQKPVINSSGYAFACYEYNEFRDNITISYFDKNKEPVYCTDGYQKVRCAFNENGDVIRRTYYNEADVPVLCKDGYAVVEKEVDPQGNATRISYFGADEKPVSSPDRAAEVLFEVDEKGCITKETNLGLSGEKVLTQDGYCIRKVTLDEQERPVEIAYYGIEEEPVYEKTGYHKLVLSYDDRGNMIRLEARGLDGQLVPFSGYWAVQDLAYNGGGYVTSVSYADQFGNPVMIQGGYASLENRYDDAGYLLSTTYLDEHGKPFVAVDVTNYGSVLVNDRSYARIEFEYDEAGNVIRESRYDEKGELSGNMASTYAVKENTYDEQGHLLESVFLDPDGTPVSVGYSKCCYTYDEAGNLTGLAFYDAGTDEPMDLSRGYQRQEVSYDFRRNPIRQASYTAAGKLAGPIVEYEYSEEGLLLSEHYVLEDGRDFPIQTGYSRIACEYDPRNNKTRVVYMDDKGNPCNSEYNFAEEIRVYDDGDNLIEKRYLDADGKPVDHAAYGFARLTEELNSWRNTLSCRLYDASGQQLLELKIEYLDEAYKTSEAIYGADGKLLGEPMFGVAKCTYEYDAYHYCTGSRFYGEDGELLMLAGETAGYNCTYENGLEISRVYIGADDRPVMLSEGYAQAKRIYDEYGREIRREYLDEAGDPVDTVFGFQAYEILYAENTTEIAQYTFYDKDGAILSDIPGEVTEVTMNLNGNTTVQGGFASTSGGTYVTQIAYVSPDGDYDMLLTPQLNLRADFTMDTVYLLQTSAARLTPEKH